MFFGVPAANLVEARSGSAEKQQLIQQFLWVQERRGNLGWGTPEHMRLAETVQALKDRGYWLDPDVQELLRLQDLGLPDLQAAARALAASLAAPCGDPAGPAGEMARRLVEWRADALPVLPALMARFVAVTTGTDPQAHPAGAGALAAAAAHMAELAQTDPYWQEVAGAFETHYGPRLQPLATWARNHLGVDI